MELLKIVDGLGEAYYLSDEAWTIDPEGWDTTVSQVSEPLNGRDGP